MIFKWKKRKLKIYFIYIYIFFLHLNIIIASPRCKSNSNNCYKCNPIKDLCEICNYPEVYSPDEFGGCSGSLKCIPDKNYCRKCDNKAELCQICDEGFIPDENGGCTYSLNCKISYKGECIECKKNFFKIGQKGGIQICKSIFSEDLSHCLSITYETGLCNFCEWGLFLTENHQCVKIQNCQESLFGNCITCKNGFYFDKLNETCKRKNNNFTYCRQTLDNKTCDICDRNSYFDEEGICVSNKYCKKSINQTCVKCIEGYYLTAKNSVCVQTKNCIEGDKDLGICMKCNTTFYLDTKDYFCKNNLEDNEYKYCSIVEEGKCSECIDDYYLGEDFKCSFTKHCEESEFGICQVCSKNYYLGYDNKCTNIERCIYSSDDYCIECENGFYFNRKNQICCEYDNDSIFNNCKYSCDNEEICCRCKDQFYLNRNNSLCYNNSEYGPFYKCSETDEEVKNCVECVVPYFLGSEDYLCSLVEGCAKIENEFRCQECMEFYCLDVNKGTCIQNDNIENDTYKIYFACNYTNEEGTACEKCLEGYVVNDEGYCIDNERCSERENGNGVCLKCEGDYCANDIFGCVISHFTDCVRCNNLSDLYWCTQCDEGYKSNSKGGCDSISNE